MLNLLLTHVLGADEDYATVLGGPPRRSSLLLRLRAAELWRAEPISVKVRSLLRLRWHPSESTHRSLGRTILLDEVFGEEADYGEHLLRLVSWHHNRDWDFAALLPEDEARSAALEALTPLTIMRVGGAPPLNLSLAKRAPLICLLLHPMVAKIPVISIRHYLQVHVRYAFNSIRRSQHPHSDELIAYLYELLFLQQKTAIALADFARAAAHAGIVKQKEESMLTAAEVDSIMQADGIFSYLKASVEKTISLLGIVYCITGLDSRKSHGSRLRALDRGVPAQAKQRQYFGFIWDRISSENLDELNRYRSGLLHKKGIADLQPHNYVGVEVSQLPLLKIFAVMHQEHALNTAALIGALALLTDDLAKRDPPALTYADIPVPTPDEVFNLIQPLLST